MSKFSSWLLKEFAARKMSQSDLARESGLTRQAISYYLSGKSKRPDDYALSEIAKVFDIPVEQVYRGAGILPPAPKSDEETERIIYEMSDLTPQEKEEVLAFINMKRNLRKRK